MALWKACFARKVLAKVNIAKHQAGVLEARTSPVQGIEQSGYCRLAMQYTEHSDALHCTVHGDVLHCTVNSDVLHCTAGSLCKLPAWLLVSYTGH
jgi:hypothetical protein